MDALRLKELRKKQLIRMNIMMLLVFSIFFGLIYNGLTVRGLWLMVISVSFIQLAFWYLKGKPMDVFLSSTNKELYEYEKERLGEEWKKQKRVQIGSQFALVGIGLLNIWAAGPNNSLLMEGGIWIYFYLALFLLGMILGNFTTINNSRKIDGEGSLQGYTNEHLMKSFVIAFIFCAIVLGLSIFFIFLV